MTGCGQTAIAIIFKYRPTFQSQGEKTMQFNILPMHVAREGTWILWYFYSTKYIARIKMLAYDTVLYTGKYELISVFQYILYEIPRIL